LHFAIIISLHCKVAIVASNTILEDKVSALSPPPSERLALLLLQASGYLYVNLYDSQGYTGNIASLQEEVLLLIFLSASSYLVPSSCLVLFFDLVYMLDDRLCGLVVRVLGYRSGGPGSIPGTTRFSEKKKKENK
jgi:hypothetical protein